MELTNKISLDNIKLIKELGEGYLGKVYLVKDLKNLNEYAMKIQKILEKDKKENRKNKKWNEIYFSLDFANKYPEHFTYLYDYLITKNCTHIPLFKVKGNVFIKNGENLIKSKYCLISFYSLIDGTLNNIIDLLSKKQYYSLLIQISYIYYLLQSNNYSHRDTHFGNFGYIKTDKKYIRIFNYDIPTYGYIFKIIDYGAVLHKNNLLTNKNKKYFYNKNELKIFMGKFLQNKNFTDYLKDKKIDIKYKKKLILFQNKEEYNLISNYVDDINDKFILYEILFPEYYQNFIIGKKFNTIYDKLKIDLIDILYIIKSKYNHKKIIKYFYTKIKNMEE